MIRCDRPLPSLTSRTYYGGPKDGENEVMKDEKAKEEKLKCVGSRRVTVLTARRAYNDATAEFETLTQAWIDGDSSAGKKRDKQSKVVMIRHLDLDPYVRGKTVMARQGINRGDGTTHWQYAGGEEVLGTSYNGIRKERASARGINALDLTRRSRHRGRVPGQRRRPEGQRVGAGARGPDRPRGALQLCRRQDGWLDPAQARPARVQLGERGHARTVQGREGARRGPGRKGGLRERGTPFQQLMSMR